MLSGRGGAGRLMWRLVERADTERLEARDERCDWRLDVWKWSSISMSTWLHLSLATRQPVHSDIQQWFVVLVGRCSPAIYDMTPCTYPPQTLPPIVEKIILKLALTRTLKNNRPRRRLIFIASAHCDFQAICFVVLFFGLKWSKSGHVSSTVQIFSHPKLFFSRAGRRHLVNAYDVKTNIGVIAGKTVWSMPERLACTTKKSTISIHLPTLLSAIEIVFSVCVLTRVSFPETSLPGLVFCLTLASIARVKF